MTRYFFVILLMALIGVAIVVKAGITMFAERQYWQDVADRFVKENVTVKPNRGNIISSDGKLMASSLPEYRIYMDFMSGEKDEKRRQKDQARRDSILNANMDSICIGLHKIFPDKSAAQFKAHLKKGRQAKSRNYLIYPKRMSGYCVIGSVANPIAPRMTIRIEITVDSTGRLINLSNFIMII